MAYRRIFYNDPQYKGDCLLNGYNYDMMVIIPAFAEEDITTTIQSVKRAQYQGIQVGLLICINEGERAESHDVEINQRAYISLCELIKEWDEESLSLHCIYVKDIPHKWAGVGMARRIAIEQAAQMLRDPVSPIVNLDADCKVSPNYLKEIYEYFQNNRGVELANIYYEHPLDKKLNYDYIVLYEAHLRYFIQIQKYLGLPYAYHTVGSSFAVRAKAYHQVGGMNKRKAGEDFYFIHKFTKKGTIRELGACTVYPSDRVSTRVPFGTGRAMQQMDRDKHWLTYHPESFRRLRDWLIKLPIIYENHNDEVLYRGNDSRLVDFLISIKASETIGKLKSNVTRYDLFLKSFFQWFDGFMLMKYLHFIREGGLDDIEVYMAIDLSAEEIGLTRCEDLLGYLLQLRQKDKISDYKGYDEMMRHYTA